MRGSKAQVARRKSLPLKAVAFVTMVCLALGSLGVWQEYLSYHRELREAEATTLNLAKSLAQHAEDTVEMADSLLVGVVQEVQTQGIGTEQARRLTARLAAQLRELPRIRGLFVYDEHGNWLASTDDRVPASANNADRAYFRHHAHSTDQRPFLGDPVKSRSGGQWIITVTRRLQDPDGSFAGVVLASVDVAYFSQFYSKFRLGAGGAVVLFKSDGTLLARWPHEDAVTGRNFSASQLFAGAAQGPAGTLRYVSPVDGTERISGYQRASRFGLVLQAAMSKDSALAAWREQSTWRGAGVSLLIIIIGATGLRLVEQARLREASESALRDSEARFRLLAENSSDMVSKLDFAGRRTYVSPSSERLLGETPADLLGRSVLDATTLDHRSRLLSVVERLRAGELNELTTEYRATRRDGREVWLESSLKVTNDPVTGKPDGAVAVTRDISARKALEAQLVSMARTDGLTGLANRRAFDEALAQEWRRAEREGTALSVVLLDVDRFKQFNDTYGHQAGDECLRIVAGAFAGLARRPGDLGARYGGEELVLLLPSTDAEGAAVIGERVRAVVQAQALRHEGNPPVGVVTVSVGVATLTATQRRLGAHAGALVEAADQALYRAKQKGRNRVEQARATFLPLPTAVA